MENAKFITSIKIKNKSSSNCIVTFTNDFSIELSMDLVLKYKLQRGSEILNDIFAQIIIEQRIIACKQIAYNFASYIPRTEQQIINKLKSKEFTVDEVNIAIEFVKIFGLIDDYEFACKFIKDSLLKKPSGEHKLKMQLLEKGISKDNIEQALRDIFPKEENQDMINSLIIKKLKILQNYSSLQQKAKLFRFLQSRGFPNNEIIQALNHYYE